MTYESLVMVVLATGSMLGSEGRPDDTVCIVRKHLPLSP
jgi:hypothetical protein